MKERYFSFLLRVDHVFGGILMLGLYSVCIFNPQASEFDFIIKITPFVVTAIDGGHVSLLPSMDRN